MVTRIRSHLMGYFLLLSVSGLVKDIERAVYLGLSSFLIEGSDSMMICYCEVWLDLRNNILLGIILFSVPMGDFP